MEYATPLLLLDLTMVKKYVGVPRDVIIRSGGYIPEGGNGTPRDRLTGLVIRQSWTVPSLHRFTWRSPVQLERALPLMAPTSRQIVLGLIGAAVIYDFLFFVPHILLHEVSSCSLAGLVNVDSPW